MTIALWCAAVIILLPYLLAAYGGYYRKKVFGVMEKNNPRAQAQQLEGYGARIYAAQQNAWENAIVFSTSVMIASVTGVEPPSAALPSVIFVLLRITHAYVYITDKPTARSIANTAGLFCCGWLIALAAMH